MRNSVCGGGVGANDCAKGRKQLFTNLGEIDEGRREKSLEAQSEEEFRQGHQTPKKKKPRR